LTGPPATDRHDSVFKDARLEPFLDQTDHARVLDPVIYETDKPFLTDRIEKAPEVRVENAVHLLAGDSNDESVQRIVLAASRSKSTRNPEKVILIDRVQHREGRFLDNFVFEGGNRDRSLSAVRLRYVLPPAWQRPISSPLDLRMQTLKLALKVCLVVPPRQPVHTGRSVTLECVEHTLKSKSIF
jgi:hypothetical protein